MRRIVRELLDLANAAGPHVKKKELYQAMMPGLAPARFPKKRAQHEGYNMGYSAQRVTTAGQVLECCLSSVSVTPL